MTFANHQRNKSGKIVEKDYNEQHLKLETDTKDLSKVRN